MTDDMRDLLNRVASGEISPEEAEARLAAAAASPADTSAAQSGAAEPTADSGEPSEPTATQHVVPEPPPTEPVRRLKVRASAVRLTVVADPTVDTAVAEGPHRVEHVGDRLTIHSDLSKGEYEAEVPRSAFASWLANVNRAGSHLRVRVNPDLPLEVLNVAGSLELDGVRAPVSVGVEAGSAKLHGGAGPLNASVASGSLEVEWEFHGTSSVSADLGSARVAVMPGSDIRVEAEAMLGLATIRMPDGTTYKSSAEGHPPVAVGSGAGELSVTTRLGSLVVTVY